MFKTPSVTNQYQRQSTLYFDNCTGVVKEEQVEDETTMNIRQNKFKMIKDENEFNKPLKRNKSIDFLQNNHVCGEYFGGVSENDQEDISDSTSGKKDNCKKVNKTYEIGYLTKELRANKIYSDDFDAMKENQMKRFKLGSVQNPAILEDSEYSEIENPYFSDNSSSSYLTN